MFGRVLNTPLQIAFLFTGMWNEVKIHSFLDGIFHQIFLSILSCLGFCCQSQIPVKFTRNVPCEKVLV